MKKKYIVAIISIIFVILVSVFQVQFDDGTFKVLSVNDGDTIVVDYFGKQETIRMIGVDTPETHHPSKPEQCFGAEASGFTTAKLLGKTVRLTADPLSGNRDRYDRLLRFIYLEDGTDYNQMLIEQGYGFAVTGFEHTKMLAYVTAGKTASDRNAGLYTECQIDYGGNYPSTSPRNSP